MTLTKNELVYNTIEEVEKQLELLLYKRPKRSNGEAVTNPLTVITGGPGTGKTTIVDGIMQVHSKLNNISVSHMASHIKVMAPTGRAAKRMREILDFNCTTIHKGLGMGYDGVFTYDDNNLIPERLIIVDESSDCWRCGSTAKCWTRTIFKRFN